MIMFGYQTSTGKISIVLPNNIFGRRDNDFRLGVSFGKTRIVLDFDLPMITRSSWAELPIEIGNARLYKPILFENHSVDRTGKNSFRPSSYNEFSSMCIGDGACLFPLSDDIDGILIKYPMKRLKFIDSPIHLGIECKSRFDWESKTEEIKGMQDRDIKPFSPIVFEWYYFFGSCDFIDEANCLRADSKFVYNLYGHGESTANLCLEYIAGIVIDTLIVGEDEGRGIDDFTNENESALVDKGRGRG